MNTDKSRRQAALEAGYNEEVANHPARIEAGRGFNYAMASLASQTGNVFLQVMHELQTRDLADEDYKTLLQGADILSKAFERFTPVKKAENPLNEGLKGAFASAIDIEPDNTSE